MLYLTRARLSDDASVNALLPLLRAGGEASRSHHLVWSLMSDGPERERDFLYRQADHGNIYILSDRHPPVSALWVSETRSVPEFEQGNCLRFTLRANPVLRRRREDGRVVKIDPIMDRLHGLPPDQRREHRMDIAREVVELWLRNIGKHSGFDLGPMALIAYRQERMRKEGAGSVTFSVVEVSGELRVTDDSAFADRLRQGFGASRAWGCGLMLCRRI